MNQDLQNIVTILKNLMSYQTVEGNKEEFEKIFVYIKSLMPEHFFIKEYEFDNRKAMVIANTEDKELDIVFCCHIDVVPASEYVCIEDEKYIHGRGSFDMKGGVAVAINLFRNLETSKKVALFITSDEEIAGFCAEQLLTIYEPKFAIIADGGKDLQIVEEEKGQLQLKLSIQTKSAHASQPYNGVNAIVTLYELYQQLIEKYPLPTSSLDYRTSINLSKLVGGDALNNVPSNASMYFDIRHTSKNSKEELLETIKQLNSEVEIEIIHAGSLFLADVTNENIQKYMEISKNITGKEPVVTSSEATSDGIYFSDKNIPTVLTNPVGDYAHAPKEYVEKESLFTLYKIWKEIVK